MDRPIALLLVAFAVLSAAINLGRSEELPAKLPPAVADVVNAHAAMVKEIQDRARKELTAERKRTIDALRALRDELAKEGKADEADLVTAEIRHLNAKRIDGAGPAIAAPAAPSQWRGRVGESYFCELTGGIDGTVWGTDVYTDDSSLTTAAVHAGVLKVGETGVVKITIAAAQEAYVGSERNGVMTNVYGSWGGSYKIERAKDEDIPPTPMADK